MIKIKVSDIKDLNEQYLIEIATLKEQIKQLDENTVIQSMNDMKEQYEELKRESVPKEIYQELRFENKRLLKMMNAIEMVNNLNIRKIFDISLFIKKTSSENRSSERFERICEKDLFDITKNFRLIHEFITDIEDDHVCMCQEH